MPVRLHTADPNFQIKFETFVTNKRDEEANVDAIAASIIDAVRQDGDVAVAKFTSKFDRILLSPEEFRLAPERITLAAQECVSETIDALKTAAMRIRSFHQTQVPEPLEYEDIDGVRLGARWTPLEAVGLYVPGGTAAYPSSVLMNAIPAKVAGCNRVVIVVPTP